MQQFGKALVLLVVLSGCGDPLRNIGRLDDVALGAPQTPATAATAPPEEQAGAPGFFQRLMSGTLTQQPVVVSTASAQAMPLEDAPAAPEQSNAMAGFFQRLMSGGAAPFSNAVPAPVAALPAEAAPDPAELAPQPSEPAPQSSEPVVTASAPAPAGLFARLLNRRRDAVPDSAPNDATIAPAPPPEVAPSEDDLIEGVALPQDQEIAPPPPETAPGAVLPWGEIGRVCDLRRRDRGAQQGADASFRLYDPAPELTTPHTMFLTGFADGCARQFTAALALFGDVGTHELVRYETSARAAPITQTDQAYEAIKAAFCHVAEGAPCGNRLDALSRNTVFLTLYPAFGGSRYADILLHDGEIIAVDFGG